MADSTTPVPQPVSTDKFVSSSNAALNRMGWIVAIVFASSLAASLEKVLPELKDVAPAWLDIVLDILVPAIVLSLAKFANSYHKDAVEGALYTDVPANTSQNE